MGKWGVREMSTKPFLKLTLANCTFSFFSSSKVSHASSYPNISPVFPFTLLSITEGGKVEGGLCRGKVIDVLIEKGDSVPE